MRRERKIRLINEIRRLEREVEDLRRRRHDVLMGANQASVSSGAGSKSFSNWTPAQYDEAIARDLREIQALKGRLRGGARLFGMVQIGRC